MQGKQYLCMLHSLQRFALHCRVHRQVEHCIHLQVLNLGHNKLQGRLQMNGLPSLRALMLNDNQLTHVDGEHNAHFWLSIFAQHVKHQKLLLAATAASPCAHTCSVDSCVCTSCHTCPCIAHN